MSTSSVGSNPIASFSGLASGLDTAGIMSKMVEYAQRPVTLLQNEITGFNSQLTAYQTLNANLIGLQTASTNLTLSSTFKQNSASSTDTSVATITAGSGAATGSHTLTVSKLAQAQQLLSSPQSSNTNALGQTGAILLNGKTINVKATDSLSDLASSINAAATGVAANVINVGNGQYRLSISANKTGLANTISITDSTGSVMSGLGIATGSSGIRQNVGASGHGAGSIVINSAAKPLGSLLGYTSTSPSGTVHITNGSTGAGNESDVSIDFSLDSLSDIAGKINAAGITGVTASVVALPDANGNNGGGGQQLQIVNSNGADPTFTDSNNVLAALGIVQKTTSSDNITTAAQDATFTFDNVNITRSYNSIGDLIPGATINLLSQTTSSKTATTNISVTQNTESIVTSIQSFVDAYNTIQKFVTDQNTFDSSNATSGAQSDSPPLLGSTTLMNIQNKLSGVLSKAVGSTTLQSIGITADTTGQLTINKSTLSNALSTNLDSVKQLFGVAGVVSDTANVKFITSTSTSSDSIGAGYKIHISQAATQAQAGATVNQTDASTQAETLTFSSNNLPSNISITLKPGNSLQDTVNQINNTASLSSYFTASIDSSGKLSIKSKAYGNSSSFNVVSNLAAASNNSGLGTQPNYTAGLDVQGTINGETAKGVGQYLTGNQTNGKANGVEVMVTATTPGDYGQVSITNGIANSMGSALTQVLDPDFGEITMAEKGLNDEISKDNAKITDVNNSVTSYQDYLQSMFSAMETRISNLQNQGNAFSAQITAMYYGTSSTKK